MMNTQNKICPLMSIGSDVFQRCVDEKCAWWYEGECSVRAMTQILAAFNKGQPPFWKEPQ